MKPPPGCQRQNHILGLIAEKGGNLRSFSSMAQRKTVMLTSYGDNGCYLP